MRQKILIIGGAGYIGSSLTERLVRNGHIITVFDNLTYGQRSLSRVQQILNGSTLEESLRDRQLKANIKDFEFIQADIRDTQKTKEIIDRGYNYVFHFGELVGINACQLNPKTTREINYEGTKNVIDAVVSSPSQPKFIWNSSSSVYHISPDGNDLSEESPLPQAEKLDDYCQNKVLIEKYLQDQLASYSDFQALVLRPATVGGLSPRPRMELLPNHIVYSLLTTRRFSLARGEDKRAVMDINDLTDFYATLVETDKWHNGIFNIGNLNQTKNWFAEKINETLNLTPPGVIEKVSQAGDLRNLTINTSKITKTFGYSPLRELKDMVEPIASLLGKDLNIFTQNPDDLLLIRDEFTNTPPADFKKLLSIT